MAQQTAVRTEREERTAEISRLWVVASDPDNPMGQRRKAWATLNRKRTSHPPVQLPDAGIPYDRFAELKGQLESDEQWRPGSLVVFVIAIGAVAVVAFAAVSLKAVWK